MISLSWGEGGGAEAGGEGLGAVVSAAVGLHAHAAAELPPGGRAGQLGQAIAAAWERHAPAAGPQADAPAARG